MTQAPDAGEATGDGQASGRRSGGPNLTRLARGGALNLVGAAVAGVQGFVLVFILAHLYPQHVAGAFFAASSLFLILAAVAGLGTDAGLLRWMPRHLALGDRTAARLMVPVALVPVAAVAALGGLLLGFGAPWLIGLTGSGELDHIVDMVRVLAVFLPIAAAQDALLAATRGHGSMRPTVLIDKIARQGLQVGGVVVAAVLSTDPTVLALAWAAPYLPGSIAAALWYRRLAGPRPTGVSGPARDLRALAGEFWSFTAPRAVAQICQTAFQRADIVLIAALSSAREAAIYTAATRFVVISQLGTQALQNVMQPAISRLFALSDHDGARRVFSVCSTWNLVLNWPIHLTIAVSAPIYLALFGGGYQGSGEIASVILALAMLVATSTGARDVILLMAGRSGLSLTNQSAALTVNVVLNLLLIPVLGIAGAALARAAGLLVRTLLALIQVRRLLNMSPTGAGLGFAALAALLSFGAVPLAARALLGSNVIALFAGVVPGLILYGCLLWSARSRLALTAFIPLMPGRRAAMEEQPPTGEVTRRAHAHGV